MQETLPLVLEHGPACTVVTLWGDMHVLYSNTAQREGVDPETYNREQTDRLRADPMMQTAQSHPETLSEWRDGCWIIVTRLPEVAGYPPTALRTQFYTDRHARRRSIDLHCQLLGLASVALQMGEMARELDVAKNLLDNSVRRQTSLRDEFIKAGSGATLRIAGEVETLSPKLSPVRGLPELGESG